jgi:very-short-patch-repair endonuclease
MCLRLANVDFQRLSRIAGRRRGLFTRTDASRCGFSAYQIRRRLDSGEWLRVVGSVYSLAGMNITTALRERALQLVVPGSVLAGPSAARALHIPVKDPHSYLLLPPHGGTRIRAARILYGDIDPRDVGRADGIPVTRHERTVFDCLRLLDGKEAVELLDHALQRELVTFQALVDRVGRQAGRRGTPKVARLLRSADPGAHSVAERILTGRLRRSGITGWLANAPIEDAQGLIGIGDVVFESVRLVVEVDGWAFHTSAERFQRDRNRQNGLIAAGWAVLRFTWLDLVDRPEYVITAIRTFILERAGG